MVYYKGFSREQVNSQQAQATRGPDISTGLGNIDAKLKQASSAIDALNGLAQGSLTAINTNINKRATEEGIREAQGDQGTTKVESESNPFAWGAEAQRTAYNKVRAQSLLVDMPSQIEQSVYNLSMNKFNKPIDELDYNQQAGLYQEAQDNYLKSKGIDKNPELFSIANMMAMDIQSKHLPKMYESSVELGKQKARKFVGSSAVMISKAVRDPESILKVFDAQDVDYASAMGLDLRKPEQKQQYDSTLDSMNKIGTRDQLDQAKLEGMLEAISNNPEQNLDLISIMKSKEFEDRFGYMPEYKKIVGQVDKISSATQEKARTVNEKQEEDLIYKAMLSHTFTNMEEVDATLNNMKFMDSKKKFELRGKAEKFLESSNAAFRLKDAYQQGNVGQIQAAPKSAQSALFSQLVMPVSDINFNDKTITIDQAQGIKNFIDKTGIVPEEIFKNANAVSFDKNVISNQVKNFRNMSGHLGIKNIGMVYDSKQQARLTVASNLMNQYGDKWSDHMSVLQKFDEDVDNNSNAAIKAKVDKQLKDVGMEKYIPKFVTEGGSNFLFGSDDMQPFFTFRDANIASQEYAGNDLKMRAYTYSLAGLPIDQAVERASEDFKKQNQWLDIGNNSVYVPMEFGADADTLTEYLSEAVVTPVGYDPDKKKSVNKYIESYNIIDKLMINNRLDPSSPELREMFLKNKISIAPTYDYYRTKQLEVSVDGIPTGEYITIGGYNKFKEHSHRLKSGDAEQKLFEVRRGLNIDKPWESRDDNAQEILDNVFKTINKVKELFK